MEYEYPFTYDFYISLIKLLKESGYIFADYLDCDDSNKTVILRHDIDNSIEKALKLAQIESNEGVKSTYFVLLTSPFYNIFQKDNREKIQQIKKLGHDIGLHFDEQNYDLEEKELDMKKLISDEIEAMEKALSLKICSVSMHRPSKKTLGEGYEFDKVVNSYGQKFFKSYKYVSDSRRRWREDIIALIESGKYNKIHLLTHAFWYNDKEKNLRESVEGFVKNANIERYDAYTENFTNLESVLRRSEL